MRNQLIYKNWTWDDDNVTYGYINKELSLPVSSLGIDTLQGGVVCDDPAILNFQQNDPLLVFHRGKQKGFFYLQSVTRTGPDRYELYALSPVGRLAQMEHRGGIYSNAPLAEVVSSICDGLPFIIKSNLTGLKISGLLPYAKPTGDDSNGLSARDNLAQVLFDIGANLGTDNNGVLRIQNLWDGLAGYIDADRVYRDGAGVRSDPPVSSVTVIEHQWVEGGDETILFDGTATDGQVVTFQDPMYGLTAEGLNIRESGANYAVLEAGSGTLTGRKYIHLTREVSRAVTVTAAVNQKRIEDATLVTILNSTAVVNRMAEYYAHRVTIAESVTIDREHPGNVVSILDPFDRKQVVATIARDGEQLSATVRASIEALVGFRPPQADNQEYFDSRVLLTGSGSWTVPEGVSQITVVLIGGGNQGSKGAAGGSVIRTRQHITSASGTFSAIGAGKGGDGGEGGLGGKILRLDLNVTEGQVFDFSTGEAGTEENEGGDTTFGEYTSANGSRSALGFTDPVTGTVYGKKGLDGSAGGDGGGVGQQGGNDGSYGQGSSTKTETKKPFNGGTATATTTYSGAGGGGRGGTGGGATESGQGTDPYAPFFSFYNLATGKTGYTNLTVNAEGYSGGGGRGGTGADGVEYGDGGGGGGGGGGAGAMGAVSTRITTSGTSGGAWGYDIYTDGMWSSGGLAGPGGAAMEGCAIIFFKTPIQIPGNGLFVEQHQKRFLVDKTGRYFIT